MHGQAFDFLLECLAEFRVGDDRKPAEQPGHVEGFAGRHQGDGMIRDLGRESRHWRETGPTQQQFAVDLV